MVHSVQESAKEHQEPKSHREEQLSVLELQMENLQNADKDEMWRILLEDLKTVFDDLVSGWSTDW